MAAYTIPSYSLILPQTDVTNEKILETRKIGLGIKNMNFTFNRITYFTGIIILKITGGKKMKDRELSSLTENLVKRDLGKKAQKNENEGTEKNKHLQSIAFNTIGSIVLGIGACMIIPPLLQRATGIVYKASKKATSSDEDDWGPVMIKKK